MKKTNMILNRIDVKRLDLSKNIIELILIYKINEMQERIERQFELNNSIIPFSIEFIKNIKDKIKMSNPGVLISFGEKEEGEEKEREKLVKGMKKLIEAIRKLKNTKESNKYMKEFHAVNNSKIIL